MATMKDFANAAVSTTTDTTVTLVRKKVVYEEKVISREEFNKLNERLEKTWNDEGYEEFYPSDIEGFEDIDFPDFTDGETGYVAFPGDVTSFTDDAIGFMFSNQPWSNYGVIEEATP